MKDEERTPLRTVLINFLSHIENLESDKYPEENYDSEFQDLKLFSEGVKGLKQYSCFEGEKEVNRKKNRYKDILPFDLSRVILNEYAGVPGSDYINANYIKGSSGSIAYIASQGPLSNTVNDFWRMVVQCEVQVIVMACNEEEAGKRKCEKYWVEEGEDRQFGLVNVKLLKASTVCPDFSVRTMRLKYTNSQSVIEERTVCQLHYVAWPDHGVPTVVQPLLDMVRLLRDTQASETLPVLVHCSAGCGRTGTICAIDYVWGLLRNGKLTKDFSLLSLVRKMRRQRIAMVQTKEQYVLVHQAVRELFKEQLNMIDSHPYENIDSSGMIRFKEEPLYDVIGNALTDGCHEEKQDDKKEKEILPLIPQKKESTVLCSKQKKEVQNFTARQKLIDYGDLKIEDHSFPSADVGHISKIKKLKSQFELYCDIPTNYSVKKLSILTSKSIDGALPIPSRGVLKVPQLEYQHSNSKTSSLIKRSKSLKILSSDERLISNEIPIDSKHKSGIELNMNEACDSWMVSAYNAKYGGFKCSKEAKDCSQVCQIVKGYEALSSANNRRPLRRSYTTLDMRQKPFSHKQSQTGIDISIDNSLIPTKNNSCLSRSQTQLEFWKAANKSNPLKDGEILSKKINVYSSKLNSNETGTCPKLSSMDIGPSYEVNIAQERAVCVSHTPDEKPSSKSSNPMRIDRASNSFQPLCLRTSKKIKDKVKKSDLSLISQDSKPEEITPTGLCDSQFTMDQCKFRPGGQRAFFAGSANEPQTQHIFLSRSSNEGKKIVNSNHSENSSVIPLKHKYPDHATSHWAHPPPMTYSSVEREVTLSPSKMSTNPIYTNTSFAKHVSIRSSQKTIGITRTPNKSKQVVQNAVNHKPVNHNYAQQSHFGTHNAFMHSSHMKTSRAGSVHPRNAHQCVQSAKITSRGNKEPIQACSSNCSDHRKGIKYSRPKNTDGVDEKLFVLAHKLDHTSLPGSSSFEGKHIIGSEVMNCVGPELCRVDNGESRVPHQEMYNWDSQQSWQSAPGVDIDQVAASISQKDGNRNKIIKAALEVLHLRKSRQQSSAVDSSDHLSGK